MFKQLLPEHDVLFDEKATMPRQELKLDEDRIGFVLQQTKTVDGGAVDGCEVGVVGFVARVGGLAILFGGVGVDDANFNPRLGEGAMNGTNRLDSWMNHAPRLMQPARTGLAWLP
jgi:hypothetical protein